MYIYIYIMSICIYIYSICAINLLLHYISNFFKDMPFNYFKLDILLGVWP